MSIELTCPYCHFSGKAPKKKMPEGVVRATCPRCRRQFRFSTSEHGIAFSIKKTGAGERVEETREETEEKSRRESTPWENRSEVGLWSGIYETCKAVLFSPEIFFSTISFKDGIREPLAFGLLIGSLGSMFSFLWPFLIWSGGTSFFGQSTMGLIFLALIVIIPIYVALGMFIWSGILHLCLLIVRGAKNGYEATFRVVSYSQAAQTWSLIPFFGGWIAGIWQLIVQIIGLREIHETSYLRVIAAFLIPLVLIIFLLVMAAIVVVFFFNQFIQHWLGQLPV
jgi:hypothetical protein